MASNEKRLGEKIREYRQKKGLTQDALASELNISSQAVSKWENGQTSPDISLIVPLSIILGIAVNDLLGGGRRDELERAWHKTWPLGDEFSLIFVEEALKEFPDDETFLYRRACDEYFLGVDKNVPEEQRELYLTRADIHFSSLHRKYPEHDIYTSFLAQVCHALGERDRALELIYTCKKSESRDRLASEFLGGEDEIRYKRNKIENLVWELFRKLEAENTPESIASARALLGILPREDQEQQVGLLRQLNFKEARFCLADGNIDGYLEKLTDAYEMLDPNHLQNDTDPVFQPLYDSKGVIRLPYMKELEGMIGYFLGNPDLIHPSSRGLRRKMLDQAAVIDDLSNTQWKNYFTFCYRHVNEKAYFRYSIDWDLTAEENDALGAVYAKYYKEMRPLAVAYMLEAYRAEVERLISGGVMTGYVARLESCPILGYCNCGAKEKYKSLPDAWKLGDLPGDAKVFSIVDVLIANSFTLCGLEEKLIDRAVSEAKSAGYTHVEAYPLERLIGYEMFDHLVAYYKKSGFEIVRDLSDEDDARCYLMRKEL